jgi:hypothetical protein
MRTSTLLLAGIFLSAGSAAGQDSETISRTIFKLSPQHFTENSLKGGVEQFNKSHSASVAVFITGRMEKNEDSFYGDGYDGLAGELQLRKYISPMKAVVLRNNKVYHRGIYGGVYVQGGSYSGDFRREYVYYNSTTGSMVSEVQYDYEDHVGNWGGGITIGYQQTFWQVIFLEAFIGGGLQFSDRIITGKLPNTPDFSYNDISDPYYRGILPKIGLNIGMGL